MRGEINGQPNKSMDVRAKQRLFKILCGKSAACA